MIEIHTHARGEIHHTTLFRRAITPERGVYSGFKHVYLLKQGVATLRLVDQVQELESPAIVYLPGLPSTQIELNAGSSAVLIGVSPDLLVDALGNAAESVLLRVFVERPAIINALHNHDASELTSLTAGIVRELASAQRSSWMAVSAYMRLILMTIWRNSGPAQTDELWRGEAKSILQSFRQLVEIHFRSRRAIMAYADDLGVTYDRLHAICVRNLNRTPKRLLHERVIQEAQLRLERSGGTVQQISNSLGFNDPAYFSHFFKRNTGQSPAAYRRMARAKADTQTLSSTSGYSDWP